MWRGVLGLIAAIVVAVVLAFLVLAFFTGCRISIHRETHINLGIDTDILNCGDDPEDSRCIQQEVERRRHSPESP